MDSIPPEVARKIGYYVYLYRHPKTGAPIYVGKGKGARVLAHLDAKGPSKMAKALRELVQSGLEPEIEILTHGIADAETAYRVEAAVIDALGLESLTNQVRGWKALQFGAMPLRELIVFYAAKPVEIDDPVLLIRINRLYHPKMTAEALYHATRGIWRLDPERAKNAKYAFGLFEGVVRAVYEIDTWHPAGAFPYPTRPDEDLKDPNRCEFVGHPAPPSIRDKYIDRSVRKYFKHGQQNPIAYVNC